MRGRQDQGKPQQGAEGPATRHLSPVCSVQQPLRHIWPEAIPLPPPPGHHHLEPGVGFMAVSPKLAVSRQGAHCPAQSGLSGAPAASGPPPVPTCSLQTTGPHCAYIRSIVHDGGSMTCILGLTSPRAVSLTVHPCPPSTLASDMFHQRLHSGGERLLAHCKH